MRTAKSIHLLRAVSPPEAYAALAAELRSRGERLGWLDWRPEQPAAEPENPAAPGQLEGAADLGVLRAVSVRGGRTVAIKSLAGPATLRDVVREHFRGCLAVLVTSNRALPDRPGGDGEAPTVAADGGRLHVRLGDRTWASTPAELCDRLRRPRPFSTAAQL